MNNPELMSDAVEVAYLYADSGIKTFKGYVEAVVEHFGEAFAREAAPFMEAGWRALNTRGIVDDPAGSVTDYLIEQHEETTQGEPGTNRSKAVGDCAGESQGDATGASDATDTGRDAGGDAEPSSDTLLSDSAATTEFDGRDGSSGLKDLGFGTQLSANVPINADMARGLGTMANGLIKAGKYKFAEFVDAAVDLIGEPAVRYLGPYLEAGWNKKAESDERLDQAVGVAELLTKESKEDESKTDGHAAVGVGTEESQEDAANAIQLELFQRPERKSAIRQLLRELEARRQQPSAMELLDKVEAAIGLEARWELLSAITDHSEDTQTTRAFREYLKSLLQGDDLIKAMRGQDAPDKEVISTIDTLLQQSSLYRDSDAFREMVEFMCRFRDYSPYNNMLVRIQNPSCSFFATEKDWNRRFQRRLIEDAKPMVILAPMHPVLLVYDLDQTEGDNLPQELNSFAKFEGEWKPRYLSSLLRNAEKYEIDVAFKELSCTNGGFATLMWGSSRAKMRVVVHAQLDEPSRFGVLCHELAHILLGHLGSDFDHWWPARTGLSRNAIEIEAEAVAWLVTSRLGLFGSSASYVSRHLRDGTTPVGISPDMIGKTASLLERMATTSMAPKKHRNRKDNKHK